MAVTLHDIREAQEAIRDRIVATPCAYSRTLSQITGAEVFIKFENLQFTASFKDRGALVKLLSLSAEERANGVIAMSAGNHAQAVAYHAQSLGIPAVIVMPQFTPNVKVEHTRGFGAEVILHGQALDEAGTFAKALARERGLSLIHPYDDEKIIAGQGTIAIEMLAAYPDLEILIVPVGGGGLISGNAIAAKAIRPNIEIVGVETARFPSMLQALQGASIECGTSTIAEGIAVKEPGKFTLSIVREFVDEILLAEEGDIEEAVLLLLEVEKTVVEGAGAAGMAALLRNRDRFAGRKVGLILSGGNIDLLILSSIIQRGLARSNRLVRLHVEVRDIPGALAKTSKLIGDLEANIIEVHHQRAFTSLPLQSVDVEFVLQTRGPVHVKRILNGLADAGCKTRLLESDAQACRDSMRESDDELGH
jgi:threonine dehydratase